jgi:STE24 endopeptidase
VSVLISILDKVGVTLHSSQCLGRFGLKYITITDALLDKATPEEATATIAHELGHWYHSHGSFDFPLKEPKAFIFASFYLLMDNPGLFQSFGFGEDITTMESGRITYPPVIAFLLFQMLGMAIQPFYKYLTNWLSHSREYQAGE